MDAWLTMISAVLAIFGIAALGLMTRRLNWLTEKADNTLLRLVVNLLMPCLILDVILGNERLLSPSDFALPPIVGFLSIVLGFAVAAGAAHFLRWLPGMQTRAQRRTFVLCVGIYNYGYIPIPLATALFDDGLAVVGVLFVHNMGVEIALWTVGILVISGNLGRDWWKRLFNPPLLAILAAIVLNLLGLYVYVPAFIHQVLHMLGAAAIPLAVLLTGAIIADHLGQASFRHGVGMMTSACLLRLGLLPIMFIAAAAMFSGSSELQRVIVLEAAMPAAVFPIIMARHYGGDPATAIRVVIATSFASLLTMPLWLQGGLHWLGVG
ncbi:AEC family transporter [Phycisphaerales bacterium AB-hyl4]|uniref:AEC family transporter n=1 Tax=Natronomicrosphaera hydrolytica TaxID=3242702 RepID=A0ABV4U2C8_9BACT